MVLGGNNARNDVEVIDLENANSVCKKPTSCPLDAFSVGTYIHETAFVCDDGFSSVCYVYNAAQGKAISTINHISSIH